MKYTSERRLSVTEAAQELRAGYIILLHDSFFEPYTVLCQAAQHANREFYEIATKLGATHISVALAGERMEALHLSPSEVDSEANSEISAPFDDAIKAIHALVDPRTQAGDRELTGKVDIQRARTGGTLKRAGYNETAVDLMRIAGLEPGSVLCILPIGGESGRGVTLRAPVFPQISGIGAGRTQGDAPTRFPIGSPERIEIQHLSGPDLQIGEISVETVARYRREHRVSHISETNLPTPEALFHLHHYQEIETGQPYLALTLGDLQNSQQPPPLLRLHSACMTGDIFGSQRCDCQAQLHAALHAIAEEGRGILLYLPQEGRGIGLSAKLQAYVLQEQGYDTVEANERLGYVADARTFSSAIEILHAMDLLHVRLLTNNPQKILALEESGITVERVALEVPPTESNAFYLQTKYERFGHLFTVQPQ